MKHKKYNNGPYYVWYNNEINEMIVSNYREFIPDGYTLINPNVIYLGEL